MILPVDLTCVIPADQLAGEDEAETKLLREMAQHAEEYLKSFKWCPPIASRLFGSGIEGAVAVFLFRLATKVSGTDDWLWVVVGDVPLAYLVTDNSPDPASALATYCDLMDEWIHAILNNSSLSDVFPVAAPATPENANKLGSRIKFIRDQIIPNCRCAK